MFLYIVTKANVPLDPYQFFLCLNKETKIDGIVFKIATKIARETYGPFKIITYVNDVLDCSG